jgi:hypothetical protein
VKLLLIIFGFLYLVGPIAVWLTQRQAANPQLVSYGRDLQDPNFQFLTTGAARLQAMGFELIGYFGWMGQTTNVNAFLAYLIHRSNGDAGMAVMTATPAGVGPQMVEFATRFADQSSLTTGNSKISGVYVRPRNKPVYHFPWITDPGRLYQIHQQLIARDFPGMAKDVPRCGAEEERLVDGMRREMADQLAPRILRLDSTGNWYRPTLLGAFRMTWKLLFPMKQIIGTVKRMKGRNLERSLMVNTTAPLAPPIHPGA